MPKFLSNFTVVGPQATSEHLDPQFRRSVSSRKVVNIVNAAFPQGTVKVVDRDAKEYDEACAVEDSICKLHNDSLRGIMHEVSERFVNLTVVNQVVEVGLSESEIVRPTVVE